MSDEVRSGLTARGEGGVALSRLPELQPRAGERPELHLARVRDTLDQDRPLREALAAAAAIYGPRAAASYTKVPLAMIVTTVPQLTTKPIHASRRGQCERCDRLVPSDAQLCGLCRTAERVAELAERRRIAAAAAKPPRPILRPVRRRAA